MSFIFFSLNHPYIVKKNTILGINNNNNDFDNQLYIAFPRLFHA